jgi:hypothetical protein
MGAAGSLDAQVDGQLLLTGERDPTPVRACAGRRRAQAMRSNSTSTTHEPGYSM